MNPLIERTINKLHLDLNEGEKQHAASVIGDALYQAIKSAEDNPNYNLKGGEDVDENTIGNNFCKSLSYIPSWVLDQLPKKADYRKMFRHCTSLNLQKDSVYVILQWFYEGDSDLVDSFLGVRSSYDEALKFLNEKVPDGYMLYTEEEVEKEEMNRSGGYGDPGFYQIKKCEL